MKHMCLWLLILGVTLRLGCSAESTEQKASNEVQNMTDASPAPTPKQEPRRYS